MTLIVGGVVVVGARTGEPGPPPKPPKPSHSSSIALTSNDERVVVVNREANSVSVIRVKNNNPRELRDNTNGSTAFGVNDFNPPSLLSINYHRPYLHRGQAQTLAEVFPLHNLPGGTIASQLTAQQQSDLLVFLKSIDGTTDHLRSAGDDFRDSIRLHGPCP